jgi:hypothetical protein
MVATIAAMDPNLKWYLAAAGFATAMAIGAVWAKGVWEDLKGPDEERPPDPGDVLDPLTNAFAAGHMTPEEYARVRESAERTEREAEPPAKDH